MMGNFDFDDEQHEELSELLERYENAVRNNQIFLIDQEALESIIDYYEEMGNFDKALEVVERSLEQYPYSSILLLKKAELLFDMKLCSKALDSLEMAAIYDPSELEIHLLKAEILTFQSRYQEAIEVLHNLIKSASDEDLSEIYLRLADVYEDNEKYPEMEQTLKNCLRYEPENEEALNRLNYCIEITENYQESIAFHKELVNQAPYCAMIWYNLACAYDGLDQYDQAIESLEYVIAIDELSDFAYQDLAEIYFKQGKYQKALQILKEFHSLGQGDEEVFFLEGQCHDALENFKMARYCYRKSLHINPAFHEAFFKIGETYEKEESWENALKAFTKASELDPQEPEYHLGVAEACLFLNKLERAISSAEESIYLKSNNSRAYILLIKTYLTIFDTDTAWEILQKGKDSCRDAQELIAVEAALLFFEGKRKQGLIKFIEAIDCNVFFSDIVFYFLPDLEKDLELNVLIAEKHKS